MAVAVLLGLTVFTAASLACGLAPDTGTLVVARFVQGAGAALMVPQVLSGIQLHFEGPDRLKALGYFSIALSGGAVAGQLLVVLPLLLGSERGWPTWSWLCLLLSIPALVLFEYGERRTAARTRSSPGLSASLWRAPATPRSPWTLPAR
ncbi:MFS transporter [Kribbella sp. HUAS MG21]|uniref:MFS transporter n=1 Tax=Kribbella sp. HUAS MG21 TaxID=3160966 RepID=A0AAU7TQR2_9ACTN